MSKTIHVRAADLASGETAQFRDLKFTPAGGPETTVKALLSAPVTIPPAPASPGTLTEVTFISDFQIDGRYVQIKTRTGKVYDPSAESEWTTVKTMPVYPD